MSQNIFAPKDLRLQRVSSTYCGLNPKIETNDYLPLAVYLNANSHSNSPSLIWRIGDFKRSLVEIFLDSNLGIIKELTIVMLPQEFVTITNVQLYDFNVIESTCPIIEKGAWPIFQDKLNHKEFESYKSENYILNKKDLVQIIVEKQFVTLLFGHSKKFSASTGNDNLIFLIDENNFINGIRIKLEAKTLDSFIKNWG